MDEDQLQDEVNAILKESPYANKYGEEAEEWAIHDYELGSISINEYPFKDLNSYVFSMKKCQLTTH